MLFHFLFGAAAAYQQAGLFIGALMCLGIGGLLLGNSLYWRVHAVRASGKIVGVIANGNMYTSVYRYALADGQMHEARSDSSSNTTGDKATGRVVPLLVSAHDPSEARAANDYSLELIALVFVLPGLVLAYVAFANFPITPMTWVMAAGMSIYLFERSRKILVPKGQRISIEEWKKQHGLGPAALDPSRIEPIEEVVANSKADIVARPGVPLSGKWAAVLAAIAAIVAAIGVSQSIEVSRLESAGIRAPGEVVAMKEEWSSGSNGGQYSYYPIIQFKTGDGRIVSFKDSVGSNPPGHQVGDGVSVLYLAANPAHDVMIDRGPFWNWALPVGLFAAAIALSGFLVTILWRQRSSTAQQAT